MRAVIRAEGVRKTYRLGESEVHAVDGVSLSVGKGEFLSIVGPSGSGKTTLLDLLSALLRPTSGEVYIKGEPVSGMDDSKLARVRGKTIGFIFQKFNLIPRMTALENVMLPLWFQGVGEGERRERAEGILAGLGLGDRLEHKPNELSGGQQQRVAIARALAVDPEVIVADEPTGNLDSKSGAGVLETIKELHESQGKTLVVVTHEDYVAGLADRKLYIKDGRIEREERRNAKRKAAGSGWK
ncbi:MAG TPA: ABC transporter ATP-binding protein [archaeon]|nr:ABC transporter ATP-binding protein [archaeon]